MKWADQDRVLAIRLMREYFRTCGIRNFEWDWMDDRYDSWLYVAREALNPSEEIEALSRRILHILPAVEDDGHPTLGRLVRRLIAEVINLEVVRD